MHEVEVSDMIPMTFAIRRMEARDEGAVFAMMRTFYDSPALLRHPSDSVLRADIDACTAPGDSVVGLVAEVGGELAGYAMAVLSWSTEYGGSCVWIEDMYIKESFRRRGIARAMFGAIEEMFPDAVRYRLEVEPSNERAIALYRSLGYEETGYTDMTKER